MHVLKAMGCRVRDVQILRQLEAENMGKHFGTSRKSFTPVLKPEPKAESGSE